LTTPSEPSYRLISLSRGLFAKVDLSNFQDLNQWKWFALKTQRGFYAGRNVIIGGRVKTLLMHRYLLNLDFGDLRQGDHVEAGQTLDNRLSNLRVVSVGQNSANSRLRRDNLIRLKGVSQSNPSGRWFARITANKRTYYLGIFDSPESAHQAYCVASEQLHGVFGRVE
jgi:hypothetical protein